MQERKERMFPFSLTFPWRLVFELCEEISSWLTFQMFTRKTEETLEKQGWQLLCRLIVYPAFNAKRSGFDA